MKRKNFNQSSIALQRKRTNDPHRIHYRWEENLGQAHSRGCQANSVSNDVGRRTALSGLPMTGYPDCPAAVRHAR